jgi:hypothetical protein
LNSSQKFISTSKLLLHSDGIEVAAFPWLYIREEYSDTLNVVKKRVCGNDNEEPKDWSLKGKLYSIKKSFYRKVMSYCRSYEQTKDLYFLVHDICQARSIIAALSQAQKLGITADIVTDNMPTSTSYWLHQQDYTVDICRSMKKLSMTDSQLVSLVANPLEQHSYTHPNVFITIAPAEWKYMSQAPFFKKYTGIDEAQPSLTLHIYHTVVKVLKDVLLVRNRFFSRVFEHCIRIEFQSRCTIHFHIALWAILGMAKHRLEGRSGEVVSELVTFLEDVFKCRIDVQIGTGFLNYINGYVTKAQTQMDFNPSQYASSNDALWFRTYRLLCKRAVMASEVFLELAGEGVSQMINSYEVDVMYPPIPSETRAATNKTLKLYHNGYVKQVFVQTNFLDYCRLYRLGDKDTIEFRKARNKTLSIGVRFNFELLDNFIGQFASVFLPHARRTAFLGKPDGMDVLQYTANFIGVQEFLYKLVYSDEPKTTVRSDGIFLHAKAFPLALPRRAESLNVFASRRDAWDYLKECILEDLRLRVSPARTETFVHRFDAVKSLYSRLYNSGLGIALKGVKENITVFNFMFFEVSSCILKFKSGVCDA